MTVNLFNADARHDFVTEQMSRLQAPDADVEGVRRNVQNLIEGATSLRLADGERAALRSYLGRLIRSHGKGEIDRDTAHRGISKVLMAAAANSPDMLNLIYEEA